MEHLVPTLHSHTHCQVAQAEPQAKTWQRVCLSNRTADRPTGGRNNEGVSTLAPNYISNRTSVRDELWVFGLLCITNCG